MHKYILRNVLYLNNRVQDFSPTRRICNHLLGEDHTFYHRMSVGALIAVVGYKIMKVEAGAFGFITESLGLMIHTIGLSPLDELIKKGMSHLKETYARK